MKFITSLLEKKISTVLCMSIAFGCRLLSLLISPFYGGDKMWQLLQSKNFLHGKGLGISKYFVSQIDYPVYDYTPKWPPGYSIIISPFLKLFKYDIFSATATLEILICIVFIVIIRKICLQLSFPTAAVNLMTIIAGCFDYPFIALHLPTDNISVVLFLLAVFCLYDNIRSNRFSILVQLLCGFLLFLPCAFRYVYLPVVPFVPCTIIIAGLSRKDKSQILKGAYTLGFLLIFQALMLLLLNEFSGQAAYVNPTEKGYHWGNLIHWFPAVPASFLSFSFFITQLNKNTPLSLDTILLMLDLTNIVGLAIISYFLYAFIRKRSFNSAPVHKWYIIFGTTSSIILFLTLGYLSFRYKAVNWVNSAWSYVGEARYFAIFFLFVQFLFIGWLFLNSSWKKNIWQKTIAIICSMVMFIEISHSIYFNGKIAFSFKKYQTNYRFADFSYFDSLLTSLGKEHPDHEILAACHEDYFFPCLASYKNKKGIFDPLDLNNGLPKVKVESFLIVIIWEGNQHLFKNFLANKNVTKLNSLANSGFYLLELFPEK